MRSTNPRLFDLKTLVYVFVFNFCVASSENLNKDIVSSGLLAKDNPSKDLFMESIEDEKSDHKQAQNRFFPSFARFEPPRNFQGIRNERAFQQERAYSQRPSSPFQQVGSFDPPFKYNGFKEDFKDNFAVKNGPGTHALLGDGNFGVIAGGTFYPEKDNDAEGSFDGFNTYYHNGHSGPSNNNFNFESQENPRPYQHEQFENFRDFADINAPADRQYSEFVVVYVNKNDTRLKAVEKVESTTVKNAPKNIIESLQMLDLETTTVEGDVPQKKLSKSKRKLAKLLSEKKLKARLALKERKEKMKDLNEPLLALS